MNEFNYHRLFLLLAFILAVFHVGGKVMEYHKAEEQYRNGPFSYKKSDDYVISGSVITGGVSNTATGELSFITGCHGKKRDK